MFFKGSRYQKVDTHTITDAKGRIVKYKRIRFIPETPATMQHTMLQGERLDLVAHRYYRDTELFWLICDANKTMLPDELVAQEGRRILIPSAQR